MDTAAKQLGLSVRWLQKVSLRLRSSKKSEVKPWQQAQRLTLAVRSQFPLQRSRLLLPCSIEHSLQKKTVLLGRWGSVSTVLFFSCLLKHRDALFSTRKKRKMLSLFESMLLQKHTSSFLYQRQGFYSSEKGCSVADWRETGQNTEWIR